MPKKKPTYRELVKLANEVKSQLAEKERQLEDTKAQLEELLEIESLRDDVASLESRIDDLEEKDTDDDELETKIRDIVEDMLGNASISI